MLIAGAVCPHPPLLIPDALGAAAASPPQPLRLVLEACDQAVRGLLDTEPDLIAVVGGSGATAELGPASAGSLHAFGIPVTVGAGVPELPLSLTVGRWLLERAGGRAGPQLLLQAVDEQASPADCRALGAALADRADRVALLAMGDASARRARRAPGAPDPEAMEYDDEVAEALAAADTRWLGKLDPGLDATLAVAGRAAWQVLAGAADGRRFHGRLLCMAAPYEVTYLVATWDQPRDG